MVWLFAIHLRDRAIVLRMNARKPRIMQRIIDATPIKMRGPRRCCSRSAAFSSGMGSGSSGCSWVRGQQLVGGGAHPRAQPWGPGAPDPGSQETVMVTLPNSGRGTERSGRASRWSGSRAALQWSGVERLELTESASGGRAQVLGISRRSSFKGNRKPQVLHGQGL